MDTQFTVSEAGVPAGSYNATFAGLEAYEENLDRFGEGCLLKFTITSGEFKGQEASRIVSKKFKSSKTKTNLLKFANALIGRELQKGETFDFADYIGTKGMIVVESTEGGATRVATFLKIAE